MLLKLHQLWTVCLQTCNICEEQSCSEWSAGALILCFCFQFLRREPDDIRSHPFFKPVEWEELEKKQERPPFRPKSVKVSRTDCAFISCHMQLALRLEVSKDTVTKW
jgi:hypothetical protein